MNNLIPDLGFYSAVMALGFAIIQASGLFLDNQRRPAILNTRTAISLTAFFLFVAYAILTYGFVISDFSMRLVYEHSFTSQPLFYRFTAVWGNHEGSMLLFCLLLTGYTLIYAWVSDYEDKASVIAFQGIWIALLLAYTVFTSNPFERLSPIPEQGNGLNPLLQDIGLSIHPPTLYLGYTGLSLALSYALTGLLKGVNPEWAQRLRPWVLVAWAWLTTGIMLGSWWAYRELGWGGFWFWDPVENASLLPWLAATSLLHCLSVQMKRGLFTGWSVFLAILCFCLSLVGFFLVRSGILNSVHSFASDPTRGIAMLAILALVSIGSLLLFCFRYPKSLEGHFNLASREAGILFNNLLLLTLLFTVFLGIIYPMLTEVLFQQAISVGAPYYQSIANPLMLTILVAACIGPFIPWKTVSKKSLRVLFPLFILVLLVIAVGFHYGISLFSALGLGAGIWLLAGTLIWAGRNRPLKRYQWGMILAHGGIGILALAISINSAAKQETIHTLRIGETLTLGRDYHIILRTLQVIKGANYLAREASFTVKQGEDEIATLTPQQRIYFADGKQTAEVAISSNPLRDIYVVIGDGDTKESVTLRAYIQPAISLIWVSALLMALGGIVAASDRQKARRI